MTSLQATQYDEASYLFPFNRLTPIEFTEIFQAQNPEISTEVNQVHNGEPTPVIQSTMPIWDYRQSKHDLTKLNFPKLDSDLSELIIALRLGAVVDTMSTIQRAAPWGWGCALRAEVLVQLPAGNTSLGSHLLKIDHWLAPQGGGGHDQYDSSLCASEVQVQRPVGEERFRFAKIARCPCGSGQWWTR